VGRKKATKSKGPDQKNKDEMAKNKQHEKKGKTKADKEDRL